MSERGRVRSENEKENMSSQEASKMLSEMIIYLINV